MNQRFSRTLYIYSLSKKDDLLTSRRLCQTAASAWIFKAVPLYRKVAAILTFSIPRPQRFTPKHVRRISPFQESQRIGDLQLAFNGQLQKTVDARQERNAWSPVRMEKLHNPERFGGHGTANQRRDEGTHALYGRPGVQLWKFTLKFKVTE
jgi:hypothetical protein